MPSPQAEEFPRLGRYQVINKIASGGMAEVFLAKATGAMGFQRLVAVKLIHANFTRDSEFVKMFIDEARIAMHLHHRNIVQVFDLDKVGDTYFIAMEYVHGVNLYDVYERIAAKGRWIEPPMALYLAAEISRGLHFAHTRSGADGRPLGIVHRDISPQNALLSFEGEVKITDFGIATAAERLHQTAAGIVKGKYAYMAPERLQEQPTDARVDVFSVGVLLYELLCGENPFAGPSAVETIENVLEKDVTPPSERGAPVGRRLDDIVMKALAKDPNQRYRSAQALADAVTEYAMELTHARKDMAAGDQALANLLAELFPERAKTMPGAADPKKLNLPGVVATPGELRGNGGVKVQTIDTAPQSQKDFSETQEDLAASEVRAHLDTPEDYDAPTLMRMSPLDVTSPQLIDFDEPGTMKSQPSIAGDDSGMVTVPPTNRKDSNLHSIETPREPSTGPTDLPGMPIDGSDPTLLGGMQVAGFQLVRSANPEVRSPRPTDDPYARTVPSNPELHSAEEKPQIIPVSQGPRSAPAHSPNGMEARSTPSHGLVPRPLPSASVASGVAFDPSSSENLVVPLGQSAEYPAALPRKRSLLEVVAFVMIGVAVLVVLATVVVVKVGQRGPAEVFVAVQSSPAGAKVIVDGFAHPEPTPTTVKVRAGAPAKVQVQLEGFRGDERLINYEEGTTPQLAFTLVPDSGRLTLSPVPPESHILIDGVDRGTGAKQLVDLALGKPMTVTFELEGYTSITQIVTLTTEEPQKKVSAALSKRERPLKTGKQVQVMLSAPPSTWGDVYYEDKPLGRTPADAMLPPGPVVLKVKTAEGREKTFNLIVPQSGGGILLDF